MTGKNVLKQQLKTGNVDMPSLSGALKESGVVSIELTTFPEHLEETSGSPSEETETGRKKERNADKGTVITGYKPEKQAMTGKNEVKQQLQTGNVDMPSESVISKKGGAVKIVHASIHERPKKARGSLTKEKKAVEIKERSTGNVALDKGDEPKNRLPQDNLQRETRGMRGKNLVKKQRQSDNVNMPSESGASKKSGAVRIVHASVHERPTRNRGSFSKEKKAVGKKERNAGKVAFDKGEEPGKNRLPQDNLQQEKREMRSKHLLKQQLQTGNINTPSASGALKKSGAVDFVLVTIHEHPKEAWGSPPEKRGTGKMKQGNDNQVATSTREQPENPVNTPEEELEEIRL